MTPRNGGGGNPEAMKRREDMEWLAGEEEELLQASSVGLCEFLCLLRQECEDLGGEELVPVATAAPARLVGAGSGRLVWLEWRGEDPLADETRALAELPHDVWTVPGDGARYLALAPGDDR